MGGGTSSFWHIALVVIAALGLVSWLRRREIGARAAWKHFLVGVAAVLAGSATYLLVHAVAPGAAGPVWIAGLSVLAGILLLTRAIFLAWRRRHMGAVLLDVGRSTQGKISLVSGIVLLFVSSGLLVMAGVADFREPATTARWGLGLCAVFFMAMGLAAVIGGATTTRAMEHGIAVPGAVVRWDRIESYWWDGPLGTILVVTVTKRRFSARTVRVEIPAAKKDAMAELMKKHVPAGQEGASVG